MSIPPAAAAVMGGFLAHCRPLCTNQSWFEYHRERQSVAAHHDVHHFMDTAFRSLMAAGKCSRSESQTGF